MNEQVVLEQARVSAASLLNVSTEAMEAKALYAKVVEGIASERAMRRATHGGGCTLTLNSLLALELKIRSDIFHEPIPPIC